MSPLKNKRYLTVLLAVTVTACGGGNAPDMPQAFSVSLNDCSEYVGVTLVPSAGVVPLVATNFVATETAPPSVPVANRQAFFVARTVRCNSTSIDGGVVRPTTLAQIGVSLLRPVGTDVSENGYTYLLAYVTDNAELAERMRSFGLPVEVSTAISHTFTAINPASGSYTAGVNSERLGNFTLGGLVTPPTAATPPIVVPFIAEWLFSGSATVRMRTTFPAISIGSPPLNSTPTVTVAATPSSTLARWLGASGGGFFIGSVFNTWTSSTMTVSYSR